MGGCIKMLKPLFAIALLSSLFLQASASADEAAFLKSGDRIVLFPLRKATVSAEVDAPVRSIPLKEGAAIRKGCVLVELDDRLCRESFLKAESAVKEAEANLDYARKVFAQDEELVVKGGIGRQEFEKARLDKATAEARLSFAEASCRAAKLNLEACRILAPYDGHVLKRVASEWEYVKAGQPLIEIVDDTQLLAVANLPSSDASAIKPGSVAKFKIDETQAEVSGSFHESSGGVNPSGRTYEVKFLIDNRDGRLLPGMSGVVLSRPSNRQAEPGQGK